MSGLRDFYKSLLYISVPLAYKALQIQLSSVPIWIELWVWIVGEWNVQAIKSARIPDSE